MSKLQTTMGAMYEALVDVPATPTAWVPLRRATVLEALRLLNGVEAAVAALHMLEDEPETDSSPTWRYPVLSAEETAGQEGAVIGNGTLTPQASTAIAANGNGHVTVEPAKRITYTQPAHSNGKTQPAPDKETNTWRRKPKAERLTLACAEIARIANGRTWVTQAEFDRSKPAEMPTANSLVPTLGLAWIELVCKALPAAVVPAAQPGKRKGKEPAAPAADPFRG